MVVRDFFFFSDEDLDLGPHPGLIQIKPQGILGADV